MQLDDDEHAFLAAKPAAQSRGAWLIVESEDDGVLITPLAAHLISAAIEQVCARAAFA